MRLSFLKQRLYRNQFIFYAITLFIVCCFVCAALLNVVIGNQIANQQQQAQVVFRSAESRLNTAAQRIDAYFLQLYATRNSSLLLDLSRFLGSTAEEYTMARLAAVPAGSSEVSFIESISEFQESNQRVFSEVFCLSSSNSQYGNAILFNADGTSDTAFFVENPYAGTAISDIGTGLRYGKRVSNSRGETLGEVIFTICPEAAFQNVSGSPPGTLAAFSRDGEYFLSEDDERLRTTARSVATGSSNSGTVGSFLLTQRHYTVYTSETFGYRLVYVADTAAMIRESPSLLLLPAGGMFFVFLSVTLLLALRMGYDARYLSQITTAISNAKAGRFTQIDVGRRHDEYGIIAEEFNVMSDALNNYIERELLLKLRQKDAEMKMLQQQIHPHFLYNTLEIIRSRALMDGDGDVAEAVYNLGAMFRAVVRSEDVIPIEQELDILTKYLHLMEFKYANHFYYRLDVEPSACRLPTVKFWMQPLIENFFVHGWDSESDMNLVVLSAERSRSEEGGDTLHFSIMNNGAKIQPDKLKALQAALDSGGEDRPDGSIGMMNICQRLRYFYGDTLRMRIQNNEEAGVTITVDAVLTETTGTPLPKEVNHV